MARKKKIMVGVAKCPNHGEPLQIDAKDRLKSKGSAPCPVSGWMFDFEQLPQGQMKDKFGNILKGFIVEGED